MLRFPARRARAGESLITRTAAGLPSCDKVLVGIAFEELDDRHPSGRFRYDLDSGQIRDQEAGPRGAELRGRRLEIVRNHAEAASRRHRGGQLGGPDAAEHRELEG